MANPRIEAIVREFPQNGMKLLLEEPRNVHDLLSLYDFDWLDWIDFTHMVRDPTTYVQRDYRHVEADVVFRAPWRPPGRPRSGRRVTLYILIEHQSKPDSLMVFRVLEYVVQIYKAQLRRWDRQHRSRAGFRFQPVFPVVFYTGTRRWETLGRMVDLVEEGACFPAVIPGLEPLFINLRALAPERLETTGGYFGWLLRLVQERRSRSGEFRALLGQVVEHLETMPAAERLRWQEMLSYIHALVYHERPF